MVYSSYLQLQAIPPARPTEKSYLKAFTLLDGIRAKLGLSDTVVEETVYLF